MTLAEQQLKSTFPGFLNFSRLSFSARHSENEQVLHTERADPRMESDARVQHTTSKTKTMEIVYSGRSTLMKDTVETGTIHDCVRVARRRQKE